MANELYQVRQAILTLAKTLRQALDELDTVDRTADLDTVSYIAFVNARGHVEWVMKEPEKGAMSG